MKIGLFNFGTRGDVQPFIALAIGLMERGYDVKVKYITPYISDYSAYKNEFGINIKSAVSNEFYKNEDFQIHNSHDNPERMKLYFHELDKHAFTAMDELAKECDLLISASGDWKMHALAEKYKKSWVTLSLQHTLIPSSLYKPRYINDDISVAQSWAQIDQHFNQNKGALINEVRSSIGLSILENPYGESNFSSELALVGISTIFCKDIVAGWANNVKVCGYLNPPPLTNELKNADTLNAFIALGEAPVYVTLGSSSFFEKDQHRILKAIVGAVSALNLRLIIQYAYSLEDIDFCQSLDNVYVLNESIDHRSVMEKCALIIHHGGTGTTHAACYSGKPSIVLYFGSDQPDWAADLESIGAAKASIVGKDVSQEWLEQQLSASLNDSSLIKKAEEIGHQMRQEHPVSTAVNFIEERYQGIKIKI